MPAYSRTVNTRRDNRSSNLTYDRMLLSYAIVVFSIAFVGGVCNAMVRQGDLREEALLQQVLQKPEYVGQNWNIEEDSPFLPGGEPAIPEDQSPIPQETKATEGPDGEIDGGCLPRNFTWEIRKLFSSINDADENVRQQETESALKIMTESMRTYEKFIDRFLAYEEAARERPRLVKLGKMDLAKSEKENEEYFLDSAQLIVKMIGLAFEMEKVNPERGNILKKNGADMLKELLRATDEARAMAGVCRANA